MSKYQLENLLNEITGTGRIGTYIATYRELINKVDELIEKGIKVKELGMSGDGKTPFEFEIYPGDKDEAFSVYPYKFNPEDEDDMETFRFSIGGKPVAMRAAKELLGDGAYSNAEIKDLREQDDANGYVDELQEVTMANVNVDEIKFHLDAYEKGVIDGDDLHQAISEIFFGKVVAPGMNSDEDFEREQRMQMSMREDTAMSGAVADELEAGVIGDRVAEEKDTSVEDLLSKIRKHLENKFEDRYRKFEYDLYIDSLERDIKRGEFDGVESIPMSDHEDDFVTYIDEKSELEENKALKEHFGRFLKNYQ